jgi:transcriptional regulator with XRE-family HTH domain
MKGKYPRSDERRTRLLDDEAGINESIEQRMIAQLGGIIERVLQERRLSQSGLARIAGMQQPDLNALIRGRTEHLPTVRTLRRLARALNIPLRVTIEPDGAVSICRQEAGRREEPTERDSAFRAP